MCFVKTSSPVVAPVAETVQRQQADANLTKNSKNNTKQGNYEQNLKTGIFGLEDTVNTTKKTLLGE